MDTIVTDVRVPHDAFTLGRTLREFPEASIELQEIVPTRSEIIPLFWVQGDDETAIEKSLRADPDVEEITRLTRTPERTLYGITWDPDVDDLVALFVEHEVEVLRAEGTAEFWEFRLQFRSREQLTNFRWACQRSDIDLELVQLYDTTLEGEKGLLSPAQHDLLTVAYENGYWDTPRESSQSELSTLIGLSQTTVSEQLRRGVKRAVARQLFGSTGEPFQ